jgi:hypothetical protein
MAHMAPPRQPGSLLVTYDDGRRRVQFRLWQIVMTAITLLATAWFMTFGLWSAVIAAMIAKHLLVVIVLVGLDLPEQPSRSSLHPDLRPFGDSAT